MAGYWRSAEDGDKESARPDPPDGLFRFRNFVVVTGHPLAILIFALRRRIVKQQVSAELPLDPFLLRGINMLSIKQTIICGALLFAVSAPTTAFGQYSMWYTTQPSQQSVQLQAAQRKIRQLQAQLQASSGGLQASSAGTVNLGGAVFVPASARFSGLSLNTNGITTLGASRLQASSGNGQLVLGASNLGTLQASNLAASGTLTGYYRVPVFVVRQRKLEASSAEEKEETCEAVECNVPCPCQEIHVPHETHSHTVPANGTIQPDAGGENPFNGDASPAQIDAVPVPTDNINPFNGT